MLEKYRNKFMAILLTLAMVIAPIPGMAITVSAAETIVTFSSGELGGSPTSLTKPCDSIGVEFSNSNGMSYDAGGLYPWEGAVSTNGYSDVKITIQIADGYTFDLTGFDMMANLGSASLELTYWDNSTGTITATQPSTGLLAPCSLIGAVNDVKKIVLTSDDYAVFQNFIINDVKSTSDATLKAASTIKGETVSLGTPNSTLGSETPGSVTITAVKAADTSNTGSYITLFDKNNTNATVKVVKYASGALTTNFATDSAYANEGITNGDFFVVRVTAQDSSVKYYRINVTVSPALSSDATLKVASTIKGQTITSLGTPNSTLGSETPGSVTITAVKAADTSNTGSYITLFDKNDTNATVKVVKYTTGSLTTNFATDSAYANEGITNGDFFIVRVTAQDSSVKYYRINVTVSPALSSDATLKAASTIKGQTITSLGTPNSTLGSETPGSVTITAVKAADTSNTGSYITLFDKNDTNATVKVVKYATGSLTTNFSTDSAYGNEAITNGDFFVVRVTAQDSSVKYYRINVTVSPALSSDATLKAVSTIKGQTITSLGTPNSTLGSETPGSVTITAVKAADTSNTGSYITLFDKNESNAAVKAVKYASGATTTNFATDSAYANEAITNGDFFVVRVTAQDSSVKYYRINVTVSSVIVPTPTPTQTTTSQEQTNNTGVEEIIVNVNNGNTDGVVSSVVIERTTDENGVKSDSITFSADKAEETIEKLKANGKSLARILIEDSKNEVSNTTVNIPTESIGAFAEGKIDLQIDTAEAKIDIPSASIQNANDKMDEDLFFRLVPVSNVDAKQEVEKRAVFEMVLMGNADSQISVLGNPIEIETNMPSAEVNITLPLTGVTIPTNELERENFLNQLGIYIEHSDGEKELVKGELVDYGNGVYGIRFQIKKFSTFTVVKTDAFLNAIDKVVVPENAEIKGNNITAYISSEVKKVVVDIDVPETAKWQLFSNQTCTKLISKNTLYLSKGTNIVYVKVTGENNSSQIYKMIIVRKPIENTKFIKLGLIGSKTYAEKIAAMFESNYNCKNVVTKEGKYYRVTLDYNNDVNIVNACEDMKKQKYIINYYYVN